MEYEPGRAGVNTRLELVHPILLAAWKRAQDLGKLMVDPLDVLVYLVEDPPVQQLLEETHIDLERLNQEIKKMDEETPQGESAKEWARILNLRPGGYRSLVLDLSIDQAIALANEDKIFNVTGPHLLAGLLRQGVNTAATAFQNLRITGQQYNTLARINNPKPLD